MQTKYVFGPSHCVRLAHASRTKQIEVPPNYKIDGLGGRPIWDTELNNKISTILQADQNAIIYIIVPDFRFGNTIINDNFNKSKKHYLTVDKLLIGEKNDKLMLDYCIQHLSQICKIGKERIKLIFWDLKVRELINASKKKYFSCGKYSHPTWNYIDLINQFRDNAINIDALNENNFHNLVIDSSLHPSHFGFNIILEIIENDHLEQNYFHEIERSYIYHQKKLIENTKLKDIIITGDSRFTRTLQRYISEKIIYLPENILCLSMKDVLTIKTDKDILFFPDIIAHGQTECELKANISSVLSNVDKIRYLHKSVSVFPYDLWAYESISKRAHYKDRFIAQTSIGITTSIESVLCNKQQRKISELSDDFESIIELNDTLLPTICGINRILGLASPVPDFDLKGNYKKFITSSCFVEDSRLISFCLNAASHGEIGIATRYSRKLIKQKPDFSSYRVFSEIAEKYLSNEDSASRWLESIIRLRNSAPAYAYVRAVIYLMKCNDLYVAEQICLEGLAKYPEDLGLRREEINLLLRNNRPELNKKLFEFEAKFEKRAIPFLKSISTLIN